jgi:hypothetical protein
MSESPKPKPRPKKSKSRRSRGSKESSEKSVSSSRAKKEAAALVAPKPVNLTNNDTSRVTNETTAVDITQYECELDNDTTALMARLEKKYHQKTASMNNKPVPVTPPLANDDDDEEGENAHLERWDENREYEENSTDDDEEEEEEVEEVQSNKFSLKSQLSIKSLQQDTLSQAPSIISEQYMESIEDLPFDDDSFVPLVVISPIPPSRRAEKSVHSGAESPAPRPARISSSTRRMQGIREMSDSVDDSDSSYPPPVSEIQLTMADNADASVAGYQSEKLSQFLKASGQDDEVAAATAQAFQAFLLSQEQAMLQLIPEDVFCDSDDDDTSLSEEYHPLAADERLRPTLDANVYAKLAALQTGMNQTHGHEQMSRTSSRGLGRSRGQHETSRHVHRGRLSSSSGKENNLQQKHRGMKRHESDRHFYDSRQARLNETLANQSSIRPCESHEEAEDLISTRSSQMARLARLESKRSVRSDRRHLAPEFDTLGRIRHNDTIIAEPTREQKLEQYNGIRQSGRITPRSTPANMGSYSNGMRGSSLLPNVYQDKAVKPRSIGSGSSMDTWSSQTSPPASVRLERTFAEQIESLPISHRACYNALKSKWELKSGGKKAFPDELYLRFAMCSRPPFDFKSAWTVMKRFDRRYLNLSVTSMEKQLLSKVSLELLQLATLHIAFIRLLTTTLLPSFQTIFPVAGLKSRAGNDSELFLIVSLRAVLCLVAD